MEIELADHFDRMNKVVEELLKGNNPTQIAAITGFKRAEVLEYIDEWKQGATATLLLSFSPPPTPHRGSAD